MALRPLRRVLLCALCSVGSHARVCSIVDFGAVGDGYTMNTKAITAAVQACAGGGTILVPAVRGHGAVFLTGSFVLTSDNLELRVEANAILRGSSEEQHYPLIGPLPSYGTGRDVPTDKRFRSLIFASNVSNISLTGSGVIDGNGHVWWEKFFMRRLKWSRPRLVELMFCRSILVEDLTFTNSPFWTIHPYASVDVTVQRVTVTAPGWAPNTDGVDPDSCRNVLIKDCVFRAGDDGVAIKSGLDAAGRAFGMASENIRIENVTVEPDFDNGSTNGVSIGSEMSGDVRNVTVVGLRVRRCAVGVYVKSMQGRGGVVENVLFSNIDADRVVQPIRFAMYYLYAGAATDGPSRGGVPAANNTTPRFRNLTVSNLTATRAWIAGVFEGLPNSTIVGVTLQGVRIDAHEPFKCTHASGVARDTSPAACFGAS